jgi:ABC-type nitrate/sulfonate/bicarbonate transport system substrate-binding protein
MSRLRLTLACGDYDRTRALQEGTIRPDGIELTYLRLPVEETFFRMMRHQEFEVAEMSLSSYVVSMQKEPSPFVALPVYTSRMFRHAGIFCHRASGIVEPTDLKGKRVGTPEYQLTAGVWIRGILEEHHGVPVDSMTYVTGGQESPGRVEKARLRLPASVTVERAPAGKTLSSMLSRGEIDALCSPRTPQPFLDRDPRVHRLFGDVVEVEKDYFARTGIFPIMHVVVIRRDVYERYPWVAQSLFKAFSAAKAEAYERLRDSSALRFMLPWMIQDLEDAEQVLGDGFWSYGLGDRDHHTLSTFLRYHHSQGLSARLLTPDDLFVPESVESAVI